MRQIRKYVLVTAHDSLTQITLPKGARPLCVNKMFDQLYVFFEVDTEETREETVSLRVIGTGIAEYKTYRSFEHGKEEEDYNLYVGAAVFGAFAWHVYVLRFEEIAQ